MLVASGLLPHQNTIQSPEGDHIGTPRTTAGSRSKVTWRTLDPSVRAIQRPPRTVRDEKAGCPGLTPGHDGCGRERRPFAQTKTGAR